MFQLDENFLKDIGLGDLPDDQKQALLQHVYEELELRVGERLAEGMSDDQMNEFEAILDRNEDRIRAWLAQYAPGYEQQDDYKRFIETTGLVGKEVPIDTLGDYTATKWLEVNRPNYRDVVAEVMQEIRQQLIEYKDQIVEKI